MFNFIKFAQDYNIYCPEGGKNTQEGWINTQCPFCGDGSNHLGYSLDRGTFNCWCCGPHSVVDYIRAILRCDVLDARKKYYYYTQIYPLGKHKQKKNKIKYYNEHVDFPEGTKEIIQVHRNYLINRNYDPDLMVKKYGIKGTSTYGDYNYRIIIPIYLNGQMVSYQGRDYTDQQTERYKACERKNEVIEHQSIVYNCDHSNSDRVIVVEGVTDVWRIGDDCVATFGMTFTLSQAYFLASLYKYFFILYDAGQLEQIQAKKLGNLLNIMGSKVETITLDEGDPGKLTDQDALHLKKDLLKVVK